MAHFDWTPSEAALAADAAELATGSAPHTQRLLQLTGQFARAGMPESQRFLDAVVGGEVAISPVYRSALLGE